MKVKKHIGFLILGLLFAASLQARHEVPEISENFNILNQSLLQNNRIEFRYLNVPEDYNNPKGKTLRLAVLIIKAVTDKPFPDPVVFLSGGPGAKAILEGNITTFLNHRFGLSRDIILMDFRGIGYSEPAFCPDIQEEIRSVIIADYTPSEATQKTLAIFERCFQTLAENNLSIEKYSSAMVAKDLDSLRKELKIEQWNLWGVSYGTRLAQTYIRDFPEPVRSVIFDSPVPMGYRFWGEQTLSYQKSLSAFFEAWNQNQDCQKTFPDLEEKFYNALELLRDEPISFKYENAPGRIGYFNFQDVHLLFHQFLYSPVFYPALPWIIESLEKKEYGFLEILAPGMAEKLHNQSDAMFVTVLKNDNDHILSDFKTSPSDPLHNALNYFDNLTHMIQQMDYVKTDSIEARAVYSEIPGLILSGSFDPITAPYHARILKESFPNSYFIEFPGEGHALSFSKSQAIVTCAEFLDNLTGIPDTTFLEEMKVKPVNWVTELYFNPKVFKFGYHLLTEKRWYMLIGTGLLFMTTAIGLFTLFLKYIRKIGRAHV